MKKIWMMCLILVMLISQCVSVFAQKETKSVTIPKNELFSQAAVLMDGETGRVLYGKNENLELPMASTTKIMTCILALEEADLDEMVTTSAYATSQPKVKLYASRGEQFLLKDLLYSLMLESHNDTAVMIAEHIGASILGFSNNPEEVVKRSATESKEAVKAFIELMNQKALSLQCYHTFFVTPNGLDGVTTYQDEKGEQIECTHSTTATDLAKMMSYCILHSPMKDAFLKITETYQYQFQNLTKTKTYSCQNHNAFLNMMQGALSGKTGYTGKAGYCYVGALERDGRYFVVALLNSGAYGNKTRKWTDTKKLMQYGITHFQYKTVYEGGIKTDSIEVYNAKPAANDYYGKVLVETRISDDKKLQFLMADWEEVEVVLKCEKLLKAPVRKNQIVGAMEVKLNGEVKAYLPVICTEEIAEKSYVDALKYIVYMYKLKTSNNNNKIF